jgi:rhamnose utilization protein RhaD (predicted bifunctional aldolase and dehydrogenase)/NAD(P)-dependent dehydrogenase (short-subunit alcohol dehydrogenase family)
MKNDWNVLEAAAHEGEIGDLVYVTRLLGKDETLGLYGGGNTSAKLTARNLVGEAEAILFIDHGHQAQQSITRDGFTSLRWERLVKLAALEALPSEALENEIACSRTMATSPVPPVDTLLHTVLPYRYMLLTRPDAILAIANTPDGPQRLRQLYGETVPVIAYASSGLTLAKACIEALPVDNPSALTGMFVRNHGLLTFGENARQAYERLVNLVTLAEQYLESHGAWNVTVGPDTEAVRQLEANKPVRQELAKLRQAVSHLAEYPLILSVQSDPAILSFCRRDDLAKLTQAGPAVAVHSELTKHIPLIGRDVDAYRVACESTISDLEPQAHGHDFGPRILLDPELGLGALGNTASETILAMRIYRHTIDIILRANALGGYQPLPVPAQTGVWNTSLFHAPASESSGSVETDHIDSQVQFAGEVALVTGGASGIGKACVQSLLARGAAVVNLDINPAVTTQYDRPDYLGLVCNLTDEAAILSAFESMAHVFGGLDMLVLNAGIFPAGCRIESLTLAEWQRVMRINLDSNLVILREAHALLKHSPRGGRVLVNASKNVLAPGAGAAAYSSSKAAVTQLARVAALEWGKDHIRVNQVHPDAIFDTGIWTEEVLKARAAHYGMTVQQYKTRNILGVELNSHYVGELVAEMLGPRFEKITGAQIPVDGGSDRVI